MKIAVTTPTGHSGSPVVQLLGLAWRQVADGFQWGNDPEESFAWTIRFVDAGRQQTSRLQAGR
jgi:hypothetical protein